MSEKRVIRLASVPECDLARGEARKSVHVRALHQACMILGSFDALACHLGAGETQLRAWLHGGAEPPESVFLAAVEVLLLAAERSGAKH
jgi:hypothetical protein